MEQENPAAMHWRMVLVFTLLSVLSSSELKSRTHVEGICTPAWTSRGRPMVPLRGGWSPEEDDMLKSLRESNLTWKQISEKMGAHRSAEACRNRFVRAQARAHSPDPPPSVKKKAAVFAPADKWSAAEDVELMALYSEFGNSWVKIEERMSTGRTKKSCRRRWERITDAEQKAKNPDRSPEPDDEKKWTEAEDEELRNLQRDLGNSWKKISVFMSTGRSEKACRSRMMRLQQMDGTQTLPHSTVQVKSTMFQQSDFVY